MVDIENVVFSRVRTAVIAVYPKAFIESTYVDRVADFPCVSLVESDNTDYTRTIEISGDVKHNNLTYDCNIYTTGDGKKGEAKKIADIIDTAMAAMGFRRTMRSQTPNIERTIYRITMRFMGIATNGIRKDDDTIIFHIFKQ